MNILIFEKEIKENTIVRVTQSEHSKDYQVSLNTADGAKFINAFNRDEAVKLCHKFILETTQ
jgi:hypothetical protein